MSSPNTNIEKQTKRHRGPLAGFAIALACVGALFVAYLFWIADDIGEADEPVITITE